MKLKHYGFTLLDLVTSLASVIDVVPSLLRYHDGMPKQLTIRGIPDEVATRLTKLSQERGKSVNAMVVEILKRAVDVHERRDRLERYATWTDEDLAEFNEALSAQRVIDEGIWH